MILVADTHALVWWVSHSKKLSAPALRALRSAAKAGPVHVSAISIFEICTLVRRQRLELGVPVGKWLAAVRALPEISIEPVTSEIAEAAGALGEHMHGDPADRIIVATARELGAKLVSADEKIAAESGVEVIW